MKLNNLLFIILILIIACCTIYLYYKCLHPKNIILSKHNDILNGKQKTVSVRANAETNAETNAEIAAADTNVNTKLKSSSDQIKLQASPVSSSLNQIEPFVAQIEPYIAQIEPDIDQTISPLKYISTNANTNIAAASTNISAAQKEKIKRVRFNDTPQYNIYDSAKNIITDKLSSRAFGDAIKYNTKASIFKRRGGNASIDSTENTSSDKSYSIGTSYSDGDSASVSASMGTNTSTDASINTSSSNDGMSETDYSDADADASTSVSTKSRPSFSVVAFNATSASNATSAGNATSAANATSAPGATNGNTGWDSAFGVPLIKNSDKKMFAKKMQKKYRNYEKSLGDFAAYQLDNDSMIKGEFAIDPFDTTDKFTKLTGRSVKDVYDEQVAGPKFKKKTVKYVTDSCVYYEDEDELTGGPLKGTNLSAYNNDGNTYGQAQFNDEF